MKKTVLTAVMALLATTITGCAWTKQHIQLNPQLDSIATQTGKGLEVGVRVVDERTERILGHRSVGTVGAEMTIDDHPEEAIKEAVLTSLRNNGFTPVEYSDALDRNLKVEIRDIKFYISMGFWTGGVHTNVALKAVAINKGHLHEEFYREENERRVLFVPGGKENERDINNTLSQALQQLHHDQKLMSFLSET